MRIAKKHQPHATLVADALGLPHPPSTFDFVLSIAVVHHLSSTTRRVQAIAAMLETLKPAPAMTDIIRNNTSGALIYVWALEQKQSRRAWDDGDEQDVMVPWVMKQGAAPQAVSDKTFDRYYHLYRRGELEQDVVAAGGAIVDSGYEKDNWWAIAVRKPSE